MHSVRLWVDNSEQEKNVLYHYAYFLVGESENKHVYMHVDHITDCGQYKKGNK